MEGMKRKRRMALLLASSVAIALGSCTGTPETSEVGTAEEAVETVDLTVMTTILPMTQFTNAVVGDRAEVILLMPTNVDPHDFQASPAAVQALASADVLVKNGLDMEFFLDDLIANAAQKLASKHLDLIVANDVSAPQVGFAHDTNAVTLLRPDAEPVEIDLASKRDVARAVIDTIIDILVSIRSPHRQDSA